MLFRSLTHNMGQNMQPARRTITDWSDTRHSDHSRGSKREQGYATSASEAPSHASRGERSQRSYSRQSDVQALEKKVENLTAAVMVLLQRNDQSLGSNTSTLNIHNEGRTETAQPPQAQQNTGHGTSACKSLPSILAPDTPTTVEQQRHDPHVQQQRSVPEKIGRAHV